MPAVQGSLVRAPSLSAFGLHRDRGCRQVAKGRPHVWPLLALDEQDPHPLTALHTHLCPTENSPTLHAPFSRTPRAL